MSHSVRPTRQRLRPYSTTTAAMATTLDSKHRRPPAHPPVLVTCRAPGSSLCDGASDHTSTTASSYYTLTAEEQQQRKTAWAPCSDDHSTGPDDVIHHVIDLDDDDLEWFEDEDDEDNEEGATKRREKQDDSPFVPIDTTFWIIDEVEICRGLAGYQEGCEPSNIHHVSVLGEEFAEEGLDDDEDDSHGPSQRTPYAKSSCATPHCRNPPSNAVHRPASQLVPRGRAVGRHPITSSTSHHPSMASGHLCTASVGRHPPAGRHPSMASRNLSVDRKPVGRAASVSTASVRNPRAASVDRSTVLSINPPLRKPANVSSRAAVPRPPPSPKTSQSKMHYETSSLGRPRSAVPPPRTSGAPPRGGGAPRQQFLV
jgi:hypothetical protein